MKLAFCALVLALSLESGVLAQSVPVKLGIDRLEARGFKELQGLRIGLVTNPSGVNSRGISTIDVLRQAPGVKLVKLFGPEHGVTGKVGAGLKVESAVHQPSGLKAYSLYGSNRKPTPEMLKGLDAVVYDLQDVGCRSYTFISTLGLVMEAAAEQGIKVIVLDRPNPLGGMRVEGPRLNPQYRSFVGMFDIPYVYGMTVGELALWINARHLKKSCQLQVIAMEGWKRNMVWEDTKLKWVPTSPNIPNTRSVRGYVATGFLGDLGVSNGANDRLPFELIASEGINSADFVQRLNRYEWSGVQIAPHSFYPMKGKFTHVKFSGVRLTIDPHAKANLTAISIYAIPILQKYFPKRDYFRNRTKEPIHMFDKLCGTSAVRVALQQGTAPSTIVAGWQAGVDSWLRERKEFLLYE